MTHDPAKPSFATDIRPLFRERDIRAMRAFFDLSSYEDVRRHAEKIWERLDAGSMPCDGMWSDENVALVRRWMDTSMAP